MTPSLEVDQSATSALSIGRAELAAYEATVAAIGQTDMAEKLFQAANHIVDVDEVFAFVATQRKKPSAILSAGVRRGASQRAALYVDRFYRLDPAAHSISSLGRTRNVVLRRVSARDISEPDYRGACYDEPGLAEKLTCGFAAGRERYVLNFYRLGRRPALGGSQFRALAGFATLALPLVRKHRALRAQDDAASGSPIERSEIQLAGRHPELTPRERVVCARTMLGQTSQEIAAALGISATTVLTYRRRAYERLGISSAAQLVGKILDRG